MRFISAKDDRTNTPVTTRIIPTHMLRLRLLFPPPTRLRAAMATDQEKKNWRPQRPDALDDRDVLDDTSLLRTQRARAPCVDMQRATAQWVGTQLAWRLRPDAAAMAPCVRTRSVRAFAFWTQRVSYRRRVSRKMSSGRRVPRHLPSGRGVSGHLPLDAARVFRTQSVKANSFQTQSVKANFFWTQSVKAKVLRTTRTTASAFWMQCVCSRRRVSRRMSSGRPVQWHLPSG